MTWPKVCLLEFCSSLAEAAEVQSMNSMAAKMAVAAVPEHFAPDCTFQYNGHNRQLKMCGDLRHLRFEIDTKGTTPHMRDCLGVPGYNIPWSPRFSHNCNDVMSLGIGNDQRGGCHAEHTILSNQ